MDSFPYIQKLSEIRKGLVADPSRPDPSWVRITTITMISKFLQEIDLKKYYRKVMKSYLLKKPFAKIVKKAAKK